jgi:two-component system response regulator YesN
MIKRTRGEEVFDICAYIVLAFVAFTTVYPFIHVLSISFSDRAEALRTGWHFYPKRVSLDAYIKVFSSPLIWISYGNTIMRTVVGTSLSLLFTVFAAYPLSKRYFPGRNVFSYIARWSANYSKYTSINEAAFIKYTFDGIADENARLEMEKNNMEGILNDNKYLLKEKYLNDLISGNMMNAKKLREYFDIFNIHTDFDSFALIAIVIEDMHDILDTLDKIEFNLKKYAIVDMISPIIDGEIFLKDDDKIIILQNTKSQGALTSLAGRIRTILQSQGNFMATIGISRIYSGLNNIERAYRDAEDALNYKIYYGKGEILAYKDIMIYNGTKQYYYPYELVNKLVAYLKQGNNNKVETVISCIIHEMNNKKIDKINIKQTFFQIIGEIMKFISQTGESIADIFEPNFDVGKAAFHANTLQEIENFMTQLCRRVIEYYNNKRTKINDNIIKRSKKFMKTNYNSNISIDTVAEHVHMSTSHLNRIFKGATGKTLNEYLIDVRINKAIELLDSTNLSVKSICQYVGYNNVSYFNKIFKAKTGTTPGRFRHQF